jgi:hypothetical protein
VTFITSPQIKLGLIKGVTWGTEVRVTGSTAVNLYASSLALNLAYADLLSRDVGQGLYRTSQARLQEDLTFTITCDLAYGQAWEALLAAFMGTESSPTETTVGQGDYSRTIDFTTATTGTTGNFHTLAWLIESGRVMAIPSFKVTGVTITQAINGAGSIQFSCIGDTVVVSSTTSAADLAGLTAYTYEESTWGGANHYLRVNTQSGSALGSGDAYQFTDYQITANRPHQTRFGSRGASTQFTLEPLQLGPTSLQLKLKYSATDSGTIDIWNYWANKTALKAEYFVDGSAIGTGVNTSLKWQFPFVQAKGKAPTGHDFPNNNSLLQPELEFELLQASAAPAGMTGVTLPRLTSIDRRSTKWFA